VRLVDVVPQRLHGITKEVAKFGTIGVVNVFVNIGMVNLLLLTVFKGGEVKANVVAVIVAATSAYFMNRHWTYRDRPKSSLRREYMLFFFFNLVGLVIQAGVVAFTKYGLHQTHIIAVNISTFVGIALGTIFRFWAYRTHVFKQATEEDDVPSTEVGVAAALADTPEPPLELDESELPMAEPEPAPSTRLVVTSSAGGSVVIKVLATEGPDAAQSIDEIDLDDPVRAAS
jgi:putative flippase GtrA